MNLATKCICCASTNLEKYPAFLTPFLAHRLFGREDKLKCNTLLCNDCGCVFQDWRYTDAEMHTLYDNYRDAEYIRTRAHYEKGYAAVDKWFEKPVPYMSQIEELLTPFLTFPFTILDWGGDDGHNAPFAQERLLLDVYDIGNRPVIPGAVKVDFPDARCYDLIICSNLLEHVPYPAETLWEIKQSMNSETVLYIEIPFEPAMCHVKEFCETGIWHEHVNMFSSNSITKLLQMCNLKVLATRNILAKISIYGSVQILLACKLAAT
jgi:hypothetical protein